MTLETPPLSSPAPSRARSATAALAYLALAVATLIQAVSTAQAAPNSLGAPLPPTDCVEALRSANIERLKGNTAGELTKLRAAQPPCDSGITGLAAMLRFHRRAPLPPEEFDALSRAVVDKTSVPGFQLSFGVAQQLVRQSDLDPDILRRVVELLEARSNQETGEQAAGSQGFAERELQVRRLRVVAEAHLKLDNHEQYAATLERLFALDKPDDVAWALLTYYREAENWDRTLELLEGLKESNPHLQPSYVLTLARAGRRAPLMKELEALAVEAESRRATATTSAANGAGDAAEGAVQTTGEGTKRSTAKSAAIFIGNGAKPPGEGIGGSHTEVRFFTSIATEIAWQFRDGGHDQDAETVFRRILSVDPNHVIANQALLHYYGSDAERAAYQDAVATQRAATTDPVELVNQGADLLAGRDYQGAYDVLLRVVSDFADDGVLEGEAVWYNFAIAAYRVEQWEHAANAFGNALEHSERVQSLVFGGMAKAKQGQHQEAIPMLQRALELDPKQRSAHYQLWVSFRTLGNESEAAKHRAAYDANQ